MKKNEYIKKSATDLMQILNMKEIDFCDWVREHCTGSEKVLRSCFPVYNLPDIPPKSKAPPESRKKAMEKRLYRYKVVTSGTVGGPDEVIKVCDTSAAKLVASDRGILSEEEPWILPCDKQERPIEWPSKGIPKIGLENILILIPKKHEAAILGMPQEPAEAKKEDQAAKQFCYDEDSRIATSKNGNEFRLSIKQGEIVKYLYEISQTGFPWKTQDHILVNINSNSRTLKDLFKRNRPAWAELIEGDGHGRFRLRV